ncbi:hypothetical protein EDM57_02825 [Brevibacillus gelatini]|uniref:Bacterial EndoU nuclease domain-containing protein n=1 Tax=Brevibacillus gelatini TaxID=1655277 RepID=A0A3M8BA86_9BACL|nr:hypothetical protein [Brevibacillus gelatini]RNB60253.1 hypothetical protein EDM57_02825 [Brevibacillus gelatini]
MKRLIASLLTLSLFSFAVVPGFAMEESSKYKTVQSQINQDKESEQQEKEIKDGETHLEAEEVQPLFWGALVRIVIEGVKLYFYYERGQEVYEAVAESKAENAVESYYEDEIEYDIFGNVKESSVLRMFGLPGYSENVYLTYGDADSDGMVHILTRHHPEYWAGETKHRNSFFNPDTTFSDIEDIIESVIDYSRNAEWMYDNLDSWGTKAYDGYHDGEIYRVIMSGENVVSVFPISYNQAE